MCLTSYLEKGKTTKLTSLGSGSVTLSIPFTQGKQALAVYLFGLYVEDKDLPELKDSNLQAEKGLPA